MPKVKIHSHSMVSANMLTVQAGTNCPQGGDGGHGGRTVLRFHDDGATAMSVKIDGKEIDNPESIELVFAGDCEFETLLEGLEFVVKTLRAQTLSMSGQEEEIY